MRIQGEHMQNVIECLILSKRSYCFFAPQGFVTRCFLIFIIDEVKNFAINIFLKLVSWSHTGNRAKVWRSYIEELRDSEAVEGFYYKFIYENCRVQKQRFCTRSETSLYYSGLPFRKVSPQVFTVKLVCFIGFLTSLYLVLFTILLCIILT